MYLRTSGRGRSFVSASVFVVFAWLTALAPTALGADAKYPPDHEARAFKTSQGGWESSASYKGLCVPGVTCPSITNGHRATGGAAGDGHLRTELGSLLGVGAESTATFRSPVFTYRGVGGATPDRLTFSIARRADVESLLSVAGNRADYSVVLHQVGATGPASRVALIDSMTLAGAERWTSSGRVDVDPAQLGIGKRYRLEVTSTFSNGAEVIPGATADFDNVVLYARTGRGGGGGTDGGGAGGGGGSISDAELKRVAAKALPPRVTVRKRGLRVKLRCARKGKAGKCKFKNLRVRAGGKTLTKKRKAKVPARKRARTVKLKPRNRKARKRIANRNRVRLTGKLRVGGKTKKISRRVKVRGS